MNYFRCIGNNGEEKYVNFKQGTFTSSSNQYGIVDVNVGFKPDLLLVKLPFANGDTVSYWEKGLNYAETHSVWCLQPAEWSSYYVELGRTSGETGIQQINNDGFSFISNGVNTRNVECYYTAVKYEKDSGGETKNLIYELQSGGQWETFSNPHTNILSVEIFDSNNDLFASHRFTEDSLGLLDIYSSYSTLLPMFDNGRSLNMARTSDTETIYISVDNVTSYSVKVYSID